MVEVAEVLADLRAESAEVDALVADLPPARWAEPTPAEGWTIAHQIAHLAWSDRASVLAITDPGGFEELLTAAFADAESYVDQGTAEFLDEPAPLLARWRAGRDELADALAAVPPGQKMPWFGTVLSPASMATARIMETWAHGLDIAEALGIRREPTARLRHIAHLGHRTYAHSFMAHDRPPPPDPVRLELTAPDGSVWSYGPGEAADRVTGSALHFCLLVTQRRHRADLDLIAHGEHADQWLDVAQVFAGPPGTGRAPTEPVP